MKLTQNQDSLSILEHIEQIAVASKDSGFSIEFQNQVKPHSDKLADFTINRSTLKLEIFKQIKNLL